MWSLFDTSGRQDARAGYRLKTLEIFNWGTFHEGEDNEGRKKGEIWKLSLNGQNTLLTGANGSGKTTLVDGLLALLVNPQKRFFNQSSGAKSSKERSEESYVEGHYGRTQNEDQQNSRVEKLRPNRFETYSIILGVFTNEGAGSVPITLAQVRWFTGSGLQRKYLVAKLELNIAEHIQFSTDGNWLRKLKRQSGDRIEDFDTFPKYATAFQRLFGMRSEKALTLFNQTVGMKVLGDLDEFIRTNMLEESDAEAAFKKLMDNYQTLLTAYQALEKARTQLNLLEPVYKLSHQYHTLAQSITATNAQCQLLEPWFARQQVRIWGEELSRQNRELDQLGDKLTIQEQAWQNADDKRVKLEISLANNQTEQEIKDLDKEIRALEKAKKEKEDNVKDYNRLARPLNFTENPDEATFRENMEQAVALQTTLADDKKHLNEQRFTSRTKANDLKKTFETLTEEIRQLQNSTGKVTGRPAAIRQEILVAVGATEAEIPFMAEVIQVQADEKLLWNDAIEKVLHNTGLDLLVPDAYYSAVNAYINAQRDLKGKVVFHRVTGKVSRPLFPDPRALVTKLEFNTKSQYAAWVENHIARRFNYLCTESQTEFERAEKALLPSGLNRNKDRHERDDSPARSHILGWDNRELLRDKQRNARELHDSISKLEKTLSSLETELTKLEDNQKRVSLFLAIKQFSKLDWQADVLNIADLSKQKASLENSSQALKTLREQLDGLKKSLTTLTEEKNHTRDEFRDTEQRIRALTNEQRTAERLLATFDSNDLDADLTKLTDLTRDVTLTYTQFGTQKEQFERKVTETINGLAGQKTSLERSIRIAMVDFKSPGKDVRATFTDWDTDTYDLKTEIDQLPEYIDRYQQIRDDNLVELENRFRDEFKSGATKALTDYCNALELQHDRICETIDQINGSLRNIAFNLNPDTYIQLERTDTRRPRIRDFRFSKLTSWQPDRTQIALADNPKEAEIDHFVNRIQPFIRELQADERWRQEVTDVRNWSEFKAREYFMADKAPRPGGSYESSGSLSGGEAAQLAYTVLGAAIAHQFGIHRGGGPRNGGPSDGHSHRSFRFIVVDEAFSKLDEDKSKYLLQLCQGLGLQLMVVTPLTSIHLLENDVSVIHWVTKSQKDRRKSTVRDIPILEYRDKKESLLAEATETP
ncbi:ATP-binding protein [Spirosoma fluviale]|uniref:Uncharacterized protein YPO0396 n=1 Tax=Spirosoma fluviale TaxID=1597977 RepID=A0A286G206_9BACT|nr:SbcC/MukB-like Walker B domain-containing protein [Spirosoma fluviale]SOD89266.1 Uncharacterized protein YPO0396 [Spirosoma fluviale]